MNIIDRSPMKTSSQEALLAQSARRISEAKTAQEKASVVQDFAEKLRLEKLRKKRLEENMKEFNDALMINAHPSASAQVPNGLQVPTVTSAVPTTIKLTLVNPNSAGAARIAPTRQESVPQTVAPAWMHPYGGQLDTYLGGGNLNHIGNGMNADRSRSRNVVGGTGGPRPPIQDPLRRFSEAGGIPGMTSAIQPVSSSPTALTPSSRALNVNAAPFVMQSKPVGSGAMGPVATRRVTVSPPITSPAVAVAPKASTFNFTQLDEKVQVQVDRRPRSASIGAEPKPPLQRQFSDQYQVMHGMGRGDMIYYQRQTMVSPLGRAPFSQLNRNSDLPRPQQPEDATAPKPRIGTVKIDLASTTGTSLLPKEDWDAEYSEPKKQEPRKASPPLNKAMGFVPPTLAPKKDWLSVLKERDDMANRRYSRDIMLQLIESEASKIRPSNLSPEYNSDVGLWSPDLWFLKNFQNDQQQSAPIRNKAFPGRGGTGNVNGIHDPMAGLRKVHCLSALEQQPQQPPQEWRRVSSDQ